MISTTARTLARGPAEALAQHIGDLRIITLDQLDAAPVPPIPLLRGSGSSGAACELAGEAEYGWALLLRLRPHTSVSGDVAVRAAASVLAAASTGVAVDSAIPRAYLPAEFAGETTSGLLTFDHDVVGTNGSVTTRGLARFGFPELTATDVPVQLLPACDALLVGAAHHVVGALRHLDDTEPAALQLPLPLRLRLADVAAGYGQPIGDDPSMQRASPVGVSASAGGTLVIGSVLDAIHALFGDALPGD